MTLTHRPPPVMTFPAPAPAPRRRRPVVVGLILGLVAAVAAFGAVTFGDRLLGSDASEPLHVLTIDQVDYLFEPTICVVGESKFVVSGSGSVDGMEFWISASESMIELASDTETELSNPDPGSEWLVADEVLTWTTTPDSSDGVILRATALVTNRNEPAEQWRVATLRAECS